jgi:hypothetical protein
MDGFGLEVTGYSETASLTSEIDVPVLPALTASPGANAPPGNADKTTSHVTNSIKEYDPTLDGAGLKVGIVMSRFNKDICEGLLSAC